MKSRRLWPALLMALGAGCLSEFTSTPARRVAIEAARPWPESLSVMAVETVHVALRDAEGNRLSGLALDWRSSDPAVISVAALPAPDSVLSGGAWRSATLADSLAAGLGAVLTARASGSVQLTAALAGEPDGYAASLAAVPLQLIQAGGAWPAAVTVTETDTIEIEVRRYTGQALDDVRATWQSSNPDVVGAVQLLPGETDRTRGDSLRAQRRAMLVARRSGSATVAVTVDREGFEPVTLGVPLAVRPLRVAPVANLPDTLTVTDSVTVQARALSGSQPLGNRVLAWSSSDPSIIQVAAVGGPSGGVARLTALRRGQAVLTAVADPNGFEPAVFQDTVAVMPLGLQPGGSWPASLSLTESTTVLLDVLRAGAAFSGATITWRSSDPLVLLVQGGPLPNDPANSGDRRALITARQRGTAEIIATAERTGFEPAVFRDTVRVDSLLLSPGPGDPDSLGLGDSAITTLVVRNVGGAALTGRAVAWTVSDPSIVRLSTVGADTTGRALLKGIAPGQAVITAAVVAPGVERASLSFPIVVDTVGVMLDDPQFVFRDTLAVTETTIVAVNTLPASWGLLADAQITFESSDPNILRVEPEPNPHLARLIGRRPARADVLVTIRRPGTQPVTARRTVTIAPLRLVATVAGAMVVSDTLRATFELRNWRDSVLRGRRVDWSSSDAARLAADVVGPDTLLLIARRSGTATVTATIDPLGLAPAEHRFALTVDSLVVRADPLAPWPSVMAVTNDSGLTVVTLRGTAGTPLARTLPVRWIANGGTISQATSRTARLRADRRGWARVTVVVGAPPFDTAYYLDSIRVMERWTAVSAGDEFACGLTASAEAYCWGGLNFFGRSLGNGSVLGDSIPSAVQGGLRFSSISAGRLHACGVSQPHGAAYCWGENNHGVIGDGTTDDQLAPVAVVGGRTFESLRTGGRVSCGVATGAIQSFCWGRFWPWPDALRTTDPLKPDFVNVPQLDSIAAGWRHACGIATGPGAIAPGAVYCWGDHYLGGRLGTGTTSSPPAQSCMPDAGDAEVISLYGNIAFPCYLTPVPVAGAVRFRMISAGALHTCGIAVDGTAWCWGDNRLGQLGDGTTISRSQPEPVAGGRTWVAIAAAGEIRTDNRTASNHTCGIDSSGLAWCWGDNRFGQLGTGSVTGPSSCGTAACAMTPQAVAAPAGAAGPLLFETITAGAGRPPGSTSNGVGFSCGVDRNGALYCWGGNANGKLGNPSAGSQSALPMRVREPVP